LDGDFVALADAHRDERQVQRVQAGGDADAVGRPGVRRPGLLEARHLGAEDVPAAPEHAGGRGVDLVAELGVGGEQVEERHPRGRADGHAAPRTTAAHSS
jgi:hypothetical protein